MSARPLCRTCNANRHAGQPHLDGCDRVLVLAGGGAVCPCGARLEWNGPLDGDGYAWLEDWQGTHADCEAMA